MELVEKADESVLKSIHHDYFILRLSKVGKINRGEAFGRIAFSCANEDVQRVFETSGSDIINPPITLKTDGKADVIVTILSTPDKQEICFVNDGAFRELSVETKEKIDWERHTKLSSVQKVFIDKRKAEKKKDTMFKFWMDDYE